MREISGRIPENSRDLVSTILRNVTGLQVESVEHINGKGMNNAVSVAETARGRFVIRTNVESHLFRFQREAWCFSKLKSTPVLTPEVLACGIISGHSYSIAPFIEGSTSIGDGIDQLSVWKTLGRYASHLNQIDAPNSKTPEGALFPIRWEEQAMSDVNSIFKDNFWVESGELSQSQQDLIRGRLLGAATINAAQGICQFDLTTANAVMCGSDYEKIYLLDLESANIAPVPYYQLACIAADKGPDAAATKAFYEGYGLSENALARISPALSLFTLYRVMRATAWARERCPALLQENLNRVRSFVADMVPLLS